MPEVYDYTPRLAGRVSGGGTVNLYGNIDQGASTRTLPDGSYREYYCIALGGWVLTAASG